MKLRKEQTLIMLEHTKDLSVKMMWLGDKLSNIRSFAREFSKVGHEVWQMCNQTDPAMQAWYYRTIVRSLKDLSEFAAYREFVQLVNYIFDDIPLN